MNRFHKAWYILKYLGPRVVWLRLGVYADKWSGRAARIFAAREWEDLKLADLLRPETPTDPDDFAQYKRDHPPEFLFPLGNPPKVPPAWPTGTAERRPPLPERLELLAQDRCVYFFRQPAPTAIDWYANPFDGHRSEPGRVWSDIPDFLPAQGDPRTLWEPARAAWAIDLARAHSHGLAADAGPLYWRWLDSWMHACPPWRGFHWKCGQESAVRFIALALGFWSLADDPATTPARWQQFARLAWATGYRIAHHINYAISQKNNHAISEACGLLLVSRLFPELRDAQRWWHLGRRVLAQEIRRQTYADGSYVQHSMNYQRVMLAGAVLGLRLAELAGEPFEHDVYDRLGRCGEFLFQMMEPETGRLPQYGANDGANVLPLSECDFTDFRPIIQATHCLAHRERRLPLGIWDEDLLWLFGPEALDSSVSTAGSATSCAFTDGGYYTLRRPESWAMLRCHTYRDRPGQYDQLHLDLWYRGQNVVQDCGTYKYYVPGRPDLEQYFRSIAAHNTVEIDDASPVELVSRFLYFPWPRGRVRRFDAPDAAQQYCEAENYDYDRAPWHVLLRRTVVSLAGNVWVVVDDVLGTGQHRALLRWHLADFPFEFDANGPALTLHTARGAFSVALSACDRRPEHVEVVRGRDEPGRVQGFASPYYGERQPIPTLEVSFGTELPLRVLTTLGPQGIMIPRLMTDSAECQRWQVGLGAVRSILELAPPKRAAESVLRGCVRAHDANRTDETTAEPGSAARASSS